LEQAFDFVQDGLQGWSLGRDNVCFPSVFVVRRGWQSQKVFHIVVLKNEAFIGALVMIDIFLQAWSRVCPSFSTIRIRGSAGKCHP